MEKQTTAKVISKRKPEIAVTICSCGASSELAVSPQMEKAHAVLQFSKNTPVDSVVNHKLSENTETSVDIFLDKNGAISTADAPVKESSDVELLIDLSNICGSANRGTYPKDTRADYYYKNDVPSSVSSPAVAGNSQSSSTIVCEEGLVIATHDGYALVTVFEELYVNRNIRWLGNNSKHRCVLQNVGQVKRFYLVTGDPRGVSTRWSYEPKKRMFWIDAVSGNFDHLGIAPTFAHAYINKPRPVTYTWPGYGSDTEDRYVAMHPNFGGVLIGPDVVRFGLSDILIYVNANDYTWRATEWFGSAAVAFSKGMSYQAVVFDARDCGDAHLASESIKRIHDQMNKLRCEEYGLSTLAWDSELAIVAKKYAEKMSEEDFFGHTDPQGKTVVDRIADRNIKASDVGEVLSKQVVSGVLVQLTDELLDAVFDGWVSSELHLALLVSTVMTHVGFGGVGKLIGETIEWYFVGVFSLPGDELVEYHFDRIKVNVDDIPAHILYSIESSNLMMPVNNPCLRAISSAPRVKFKPHSIAHRGILWDKYRTGQVTNYTHTEEYGFTAQDMCTGSGNYTCGLSGPYMDSISYNFRGRNGEATVYLEYDPDGRSIYLELGPRSCKLMSNDRVLESTAQGVGDDTMLSDIIVGTVFHSCPEYNPDEPDIYLQGETLITYAVSKLEYHEVNYWEEERYHKIMQEDYFETSMEYWAVLLDADNEIVSKFQLGGIADIDEKPIEYDSVYRQQHANGTQENYIFQMEGPIKPETVIIKFMIVGNNFEVYDDGAGVIDDTSGYIATSVIDYNTGTIEISFGSPSPDNNSVVVAIAMVGQIKDRFRLFNQEGTLAMYNGYFSSMHDGDVPGCNARMFTLSGDIPICPSYTITQDGEYIVGTFNMYSGDIIEDEANARLVSPQHLDELDTTVKFDVPAGHIQYIVYNRFGELVAGPFFVPSNQRYSTSVVLN